MLIEVTALITLVRDKIMGITFNLTPYIVIGVLQIYAAYIIYKNHTTVNFKTTFSEARQEISKEGARDGLALRVFAYFLLLTDYSFPGRDSVVLYKIC